MKRTILCLLPIYLLPVVFCPAAFAQKIELPTIYVAGDSTAANGTVGARGWGRHLAEFFNTKVVRVENRARGGRSSRTFVSEGLWEALRSELKPHDIVFIQFGHNDGGTINDPRRARGSLPGLGEEIREIENEQAGNHEVVHTYGWYMRKMVSETRAAGAVPILLSLTVRNEWREDKVERGVGRYNEWIRELARTEGVAFIDLTNLIADTYEKLGPETVAQFFSQDHTHTNDTGARLTARHVVRGFKGLREEMWRQWLSVLGRIEQRAEPKFVMFPNVNRGADESRFLNTPYPADENLPTLWLVGDSTVRTGRGRGENNQFGWGDPIENFFDQSRINVVNRAMGGTGARTFRSNGLWSAVLEQIKAGDVVLIQFGHNDNGAGGALPGTGDGTESRPGPGGVEEVRSFGAYLRMFVEEIREKEATPILCSLIPRNVWRDGKIARSTDGHASWTQQVAETEDVEFIDLYERIAQRYDLMRQNVVTTLFADGRTHTTYEGADLNAQCVIEGLAALGDTNPLAEYWLEDRLEELATGWQVFND